VSEHSEKKTEVFLQGQLMALKQEGEPWQSFRSEDLMEWWKAVQSNVRKKGFSRAFCNSTAQPFSALVMKTPRSSKCGNKSIVINDRMQKGYRYELSVPVGRNFDPEFKPELTPAEMLVLGVFCGKYMTDDARGVYEKLV
jgi:hypothetical protein